MRRLAFDLEADNLLPDVTKVHCIVSADVDTGEQHVFGPSEIPAALEHLEKADVSIAHNGLRYDWPVLEKLFGFKVPFLKKRDTLVIGRTIHPNIKENDSRFNATLIKRGQPAMGAMFGSHSIEAWGLRLGIPKVGAGITDWSQWTQEIQDRCVGDIATMVRLWKYLNPDAYSQQALALEHRVAVVCEEITTDGWPFNMAKATALHVRLVGEKAELEAQLKAQFGSWWQDNGEFTPKVNNKARGYVKGQTCTKIERIDFNPSSRQHIELCMRKLGWKPVEFTEGGQAKLDEEIIENIASEYPQLAGLTKYLTIEKRLGQLADGPQAWLKHVGKDGRVHAAYNPMGAVTSRASHFHPNIAQVPTNSSLYGHECRELFYVPEDWGQQLGADASGLELRCLAHYMAKHDGGAYGKLILEGDVHWENVLAMGLIALMPRDFQDALHTLLRELGAKRFLYAWLYGAGDEKAGRIILEACRAAYKLGPEGVAVYKKFFGDDMAPASRLLKSVGKELKNQFLHKTPALAKLVHIVKGQAEAYGALKGLDGRRLPIRYAHAALNTLLQSAGAILCKQWLCDARDALLADGLKRGWDGDFVILGWIHDEVQIACRNGLGDRIGRLLTSAAQRAGEPFKFRIALDSDYKLGKSWADTH